MATPSGVPAGGNSLRRGGYFTPVTRGPALPLPSSGPGTTGPTVLVLSADMGEGHNSTGRALEEAAFEAWPGCRVNWLDTLEVMGPGVGPVFRRIYVTNVNSTPWLYEFFYATLWGSPWFARACKRFVGAWVGRRLRPCLRSLQPDLILSTYPLGSAGLAWLRRCQELPQPAAAWVSDFAPHPFWVYRELDRTYVMHELAVELGRRADPAARLAVSGPVVQRRFRTAPDPGTRAAVRARMGIAPDPPLVLFMAGAFGFGDLREAVGRLLEIDRDLSVVVVCGRNETLRQRLSTLPFGPGRLGVLGWVSDIPALLAAADAVVSNAGGASALEALAAGRPLLMFRPIAAHGKANAELIARAGLAENCATVGELAAAVRRLRAAGRAPGPAAEQAPGSATPPLDLVGQLRCLMGDRQSGSYRRLAAPDALFLNVDTPQVPQQIGVAIVLAGDGAEPVSPQTLAGFARAVPGSDGYLERGRWWHGPRWVPCPGPAVDPVADMIDVAACREGTQEEDGGTGSVTAVRDGSRRLIAAAVDEVFSHRPDLSGPAVRVRLLTGLPGDEAVLVLRVHHALCDGVVLTRALAAAEREPRPPGRRDERGLSGRPDPRLRRTVRGVFSLLRAGRAPDCVLTAQIPDPTRRYLLVDLPAAQARTAARQHGVTVGELLVGLLGQALRTIVPGLDSSAGFVRMMVPRTLRGRDHPGDVEDRVTRGGRPGTGNRNGSGNRTGAVSLDVPVTAMPLHDRLLAVSRQLRRRVDEGQPVAAHAIVRLTDVLPPPVRGWVHRRMYGARWFSVIATVLPGIPRGSVVCGRRVVAAYPVLPLAPGVNVAFGAVPGAETIAVCITLGPALARHGAGLARALPDALTEALDTSAPVPVESGRARPLGRSRRWRVALVWTRARVARSRYRA